jgi:hypothetical protein
MIGEIKGNKRTYPVKVGTAITGKIRDTSYRGAESYHHKREREIHLIREQVAATISEREKIHYRGAGACHYK